MPYVVNTAPGLRCAFQALAKSRTINVKIRQCMNRALSIPKHNAFSTTQDATGGLELVPPVEEGYIQLRRVDTRKKTDKLSSVDGGAVAAAGWASRAEPAPKSPFAYGVSKAAADPYDFPHSYVSPTDFTASAFSVSAKPPIPASKGFAPTAAPSNQENPLDIAHTVNASISPSVSSVTDKPNKVRRVVVEAGRPRLPRKLLRALEDSAPTAALSKEQSAAVDPTSYHVPAYALKATTKPQPTVPSNSVPADDRTNKPSDTSNTNASPATPDPVAATAAVNAPAAVSDKQPSVAAVSDKQPYVTRPAFGAPFSSQTSGLPTKLYKTVSSLHTRRPAAAINLAKAMLEEKLLTKCRDADVTQLCTALSWCASQGDVQASNEWMKATKRSISVVKSIFASVETYWKGRLDKDVASSQGPVSLRSLVWMLNALHRMNSPLPALQAEMAQTLAAMNYRAWKASDVSSMTHLFSLRDRTQRVMYAPVLVKVCKLLDNQSVLVSLDDVCLAGLLHAFDCQYHAAPISGGLSKHECVKYANIVCAALLQRLTHFDAPAPAAITNNANITFPGVPNYGIGKLLSHPDGCMALGLFVLSSHRIPGLPHQQITAKAAEAIGKHGATAISTRTITSIFTSYAQNASASPPLSFLQAVYDKFNAEEPLLEAAIKRFLSDTSASSSATSSSEMDGAEGGEVGAFSDVVSPEMSEEDVVDDVSSTNANTASSTSTAASMRNESTQDITASTAAGNGQWLPVKIALLHLRSIPDLLWSIRAFTTTHSPLMELLTRQLTIATHVAHEVSVRGEDNRPRMVQGLSPAAVTSAELPEAVSLGACVAAFSVISKLKPSNSIETMFESLPYVHHQLDMHQRSVKAAASRAHVSLNFETYSYSSDSADESAAAVESESDGMDDVSHSKAANNARSVNILPPWVRESSDLIHAYSHLLADAARLGVDGEPIKQLHDKAAVIVPSILRAYHDSKQVQADMEGLVAMIAAGKHPKLDGFKDVDTDSSPTLSIDSTGIDPTRARLRDGLVKRAHYRYFQLDAADDVSRYGLQITPPFPLSVCTDLAATFAARGYPAKDLMQMLGLHVSSMLGVKPIRPMLSPSHLARFLHAVARARESKPALFKAAGKYMRWLLQTPALCSNLPPTFYLTFLRSCLISRYRMPVTINAICDHIAGVHYLEDTAKSSVPWSDSALPAFTDAVTSCDERSEAASAYLSKHYEFVPPKRRVCRREDGLARFTSVELQDLMSLLHQLEIRHPPLEDMIWRRISPNTDAAASNFAAAKTHVLQ